MISVVSTCPSVHATRTQNKHLLERNETRGVGGTNTGPTVLDGLAVAVVRHRFFQGYDFTEYVLGDGELSQVVANHLRLDLNLVELLAGVDTDDAADHLRDDNHVTEVGLDEVGLLVGLGLLLGLAELLDQAHGLALETTVEPATGTGVDDIAKLLGGEVEEPDLLSDSHHLCSIRIQRTGQGRYHGRKTCGRFSSS